MLASKKCVPCEVGGPSLTKEVALNFLRKLNSDWKITGTNKKISREFKFKDFNETMIFINKVAEIAEIEGHHPDLHIFYNKVTIELWTHAVGGLSENDFILASKIDTIKVIGK